MMAAIKKYLSIGLAGLLVLAVIYCLLVSNQRDNALNKLDKANEQVSGLIKDNKGLKGTIDLMRKNAEEDRRYMADLEKREAETEEKTNSLELKFKKAKNENKTINTWANDKLPVGLY